ncbi:MAG: flavodoxin family protein, partial [Armatimonadota bacterium]
LKSLLGGLAIRAPKGTKMKIAAITGSPHGMKGQTGILLDGMLDAMRGAGADVTTFDLSALSVAPCRGCDACHRNGACAIDDDYQAIRTAMTEADGVVIASPNYFVSVSAQLKAMIDRCCGLIHLQAIEGKYGAAVVTSGGPGGEEVENYLLRFMRSLGYATVGSVGALGWQMRLDGMKEPHLQAAAQLGVELVGAIRERKQYPEQAPERAAIMERMKGLMIAQKDRWPYEYQYWVERQRI